MPRIGFSLVIDQSLFHNTFRARFWLRFSLYSRNERPLFCPQVASVYC